MNHAVRPEFTQSETPIKMLSTPRCIRERTKKTTRSPENFRMSNKRKETLVLWRETIPTNQKERIG